jgi:type I restriction enzyme S subunit
VRFQRRRLAGIAEVRLGRQRSPERAEGPNMVSYLRAANVVDGTLDLTDVKSMDFTPEEQRLFALEHGDVLVTEGSGSLRTVGASAVYRNELPQRVCFQNTLLRLRPRGKVIIPDFLAWWARSAYASGLFAAAATGANIHHLSAERLKSLSVPVPDTARQRRIADYLDRETHRIDTLIAKNQVLQHRMTERFESTWDQLLSTRHIQRVQLRRCLRRVSDGPFGSNLASQHYVDDSDAVRVIRLGNIGRAALLDRSVARVSHDHADVLSNYRVRSGDVVVASLGGGEIAPGRAAAVTPEWAGAVHKADCFRLQVDQRVVSARYLAMALSSRRVLTETSLMTKGVTRERLTTDLVREILLPFLDPAGQAEIVRSWLEESAQMGAIKSRIVGQQALLTERRQALITAAVTGELEIPRVAA